VLWDVRIASDAAYFAHPEHAFMTSCSARCTISSGALDLASPAGASAQEALVLRLVSRVVPAADLMGEAEGVARMIAGRSPRPRPHKGRRWRRRPAGTPTLDL
jgi:enoyl-CoA hydratase/carnithine racemase